MRLRAGQLAARSRFGAPRAVERAAQALPEHYELELRGVRLLISSTSPPFAGSSRGGAPLRASPRRLSHNGPAGRLGRSFRLTGALIIQVVLRSFFPSGGLPFGTGAAMQLHHCGLNRARGIS